MTDEPTEVLDERIETAISVLDLACHPNTADTEAIAAIKAFRRVTKGKIPSILCRDYYGSFSDPEIIEEEWEELLAQKEMEISRLRNEIRRLKKTLDDSKRRKRRGSDEEPASTVSSVPKDIPSMVLTDEAWAAILNIIPGRMRNERGRARLAIITTIVRQGIPWRVLATDEKPNGWTTFYNQYHQTLRHEPWWDAMMGVLANVVVTEEDSTGAGTADPAL
jgi:hypothetical protein